MRFPAINGQKRQKVSIPKLNGGVNYRDALNLVEDNQLTDVRNMWFKDGALRTRYGLSLNDDDGTPYVDFSGDIAAHCFCRASGNTFVIEENQLLPQYPTIHAFDIDGCHIGQVTILGESNLIVPYGQIYVTEDGDKAIQEAIVYCKNGKIYGVRVDTDTIKYTEMQPYVPIVMMSGKGTSVTGSESVGGDFIEGYNLLTERYRAYYNTDGQSTKYYLPTNAPAESNISVVCQQGSVKYTWSGIVGGTATADGTNITATFESDSITFSSPLPEVEGRSNNLKVTASSLDRRTELLVIQYMNTYAWFGGGGGIDAGTRLFLAGDIDYPNRVYYSGVNNPLYFSTSNHMDVGSADSKVTAFGKQSDLLVIFKSDETYFTTYSQGATISSESVMEGAVVGIETVQAIFPLAQLSGNIGCDLPQTIRLMQNRLMWADSYGRVWTLIYSNEYSTRNIRAVGGLINRKMKDKNINLNNTIAVTYDNYYMLLITDTMDYSNTAFVLDTEDYGYAYYTSYGSDKKAQSSMGWYAWELPQLNIMFSDERAGAPLIFAKTGDRLIAYTMADGSDEMMDEDGNITETRIPCMFQTKLFDMKYPEKQKVFDRIYLSVGESQELCAQAVYVTEKVNFTDSAKIASEGISDAFTAKFISNITLSPNVRAKRFALRVENDGTMYIDSISIYYRV